MRALLLLCVASSAYAGTNELSIGGATRALRAPSADALTPDSLGGGQIGYARALGVAVPYGLALWVDTDFEWGSARGSVFQTMETTIDSLAPMVGARLVYQPHRRVALAGRLALGGAREALTLSDGNGAQVTDHAWGAVATVSVAMDLRLLAGPKLDLALRLQLGYVEASRVALTPHGDGPGDNTLTLPLMDQSIGHLDLSGPTAGFAMVASF